ncbi:circularly permuted type 2 ATP-grasp protein [Nocardioides zeae]|uniref:Circularly permuted type 2 ATP-grasp protein n=1 Tax=Nocardioides imazamoxiresistens TaxID=3231893 RepID=A0ABU3PUA2_9ACTN|nr:circularly permuted type 2 ATP-grasp protein [Nocardioides zeae]MDT9592809.1 circularly permuted type 2 ATP-grasp protein [Nocardioides zeae]
MTVLSDYTAALAQPRLDPAPTRYDELVGADGALRPAWRPLLDVALRLTAGDLARVDTDIRHALADDGVTYAAPGRGVEPWRLDPVPLVLDADEWTGLEVALAQRAELLDAVVADLYGPRTLLRDGVLPAPLVLGHSGYVRVMARASAADPHPLLLTATDLGRTGDGEWRVLADRAQAPSGLGYAMQNRRVISRVLPELYRQASPHRLAPFFHALRSSLLQAAPGDPASPRVVVLSPGPHSETAFDQAFLASTLGFPLVQGGDLVVRDGAVWMRVFEHLERVHVILRRVDAAWSDPLELRAGSRLGVAGLSEAVRRGTVRVVNGLGAGVVENPGLLPYLPAAAQHLLGEDLRLDSVPTWWCGDEANRRTVLGRLDELEVRRIDGGRVGGGRDALRKRIEAEPHLYVGQQPLPLSQAPTFGRGPGAVGAGGAGDLLEAYAPASGAVTPGSVTLRTFTLLHGSSYRPMVGALATVRERHDGLQAARSVSKDVWVLKRDAADPDQHLAHQLQPAYTDASAAVLPRTLDDLYWFGRYVERAEDTLRLVLTAHALAEDYRTRPFSSGGASLAVAWKALHDLCPPGRPVRFDDPAVREELFGDRLDAEFHAVLLDSDRAGGVAQSVAALRACAQGVRDQLSADAWRAFASVERSAAVLATSRHSHQVEEAGGRMLNGVLALTGVVANMMRDPGWHMIGAGRSLERVLQVARLLRSTVVERRGLDTDRRVLNAVLGSTESVVTHRRRHRGYVKVGSVLELLLLDPANPRSVVSALADLRGHLAAMPASTGSTRSERLLDELGERVESVDVRALVALGGARRPHLDHFLADLVAETARLSDAIEALHFPAGPGPRSFAQLLPRGAGSDDLLVEAGGDG